MINKDNEENVGKKLIKINKNIEFSKKNRKKCMNYFFLKKLRKF